MDRNKLKTALVAAYVALFILFGVLYATSVFSKAAWGTICMVMTLLAIIYKVINMKAKPKKPQTHLRKK